MRAGEYAAKYARENSAGQINNAQVDEAAKEALAPFERNTNEGPFQIQQDLQQAMQDLVGIVRTEAEMQQVTLTEHTETLA